MRKPLVVLTEAIDCRAMSRLRSHAEVHILPDKQPQTYQSWMQQAAVLIVRSQLPSDIFAHAPLLRGVVRHGVGLDAIPMDRANELAIPVANVPGGNARAVAEHAGIAMGMLIRNWQAIDRALRTHGWDAGRNASATARGLAGKRVGILGMGDVGREIARLCHEGLEMQVFGHQRRLDAMPAYVQPVTLEALFTESDFVVLACPLTPETRHICSANHIARMKRRAYLVNIGRGGLVDTAGLIEALRAGHIGGAALDVLEDPPLMLNSNLLDVPGLVLTPHVAGITEEAMAFIGSATVDQTLDLLAGRKPQFLVNPEVWGRQTRTCSSSVQ